MPAGPSPASETPRPTTTRRPAAAERAVWPAVTWLRWILIATMLGIAVVWPIPGRGGQDVWPLVLVLAAYNLVVQILRVRLPRLQGYRWVGLVDLPIAGLLAFLDSEPGGPLFVAFVMAAVTAATSFGLRGMTLYLLAAVATILVVAATLPEWSADPLALRQLSARMVVLVLIGLGTTVLIRRLAREQARARILRQEADRLEALDRVRSAFLASVSHDLRTPLTAARAGLGMLETSARGRLLPEEAELLANARRGVDRLARYIDDLLALNQLAAGTLRLDREPLDLRAVAADAVAVVQPLLQQKGQALESDLTTPLPVLGDRTALERTLVNLVGNAHQHTPPGTRIAISATVSTGAVVVTIANAGPHMSDRDFDRLLGRPQRSDPLSAGSGMGLSIARGFAALHGGRLWVERPSDGGVAVRLALPRDSTRRAD